MNNGRVYVVRALLVVGALAVSSAFGDAQAAVITFEDIAVAAGSNSIGGDRISGGFNFDSSTNHTHLVHDTGGVDAWNGTTTFQSDDNSGDDLLTMTKVGGGAFSLNSLDLGEGFDYAAQGATQVRIKGTPTVGAPLILDVLVDGIFDARGAGVDFQAVVFGAAWASLTSVSFDGITGPSIRTFLLDNIQVDAAVPEPTTLVLLGIGLAGASAWRRRKP